MTEPVDNEQWRLASFAGTFTLIEHAAQLLAENLFTDEELLAIQQFTPERRMKLTARLMDLAEIVRNSQRVLDWHVTVLEHELHGEAVSSD